MANEFKLKFEYKDAGKNMAAVRQKVLAAQKKAGGEGAKVGGASAVMKKLDGSILKLIESNKALASALKGGTPGGGGGRGGGRGPRASFGGVGASLPIAGAAIALSGFVVKKMQQITDAYISKVMEQKGTAGIGGFQRGAVGTYLGAERSAGRKAFAMATGKFGAGGISEAESQYGGLFGMSAGDVRGTAGRIKRGGGNFAETAYQGLGAGIETELPTLMSGVASELEEAVKKGINTSDMAPNLGKEISAITMQTETKSVDAALNIIRSFKSVQQSVASGKIGGVEQLYARQGAQSMLMERIKDPEYIKRLQKSGSISKAQAEKLKGFKGGYGELQQTLGASGAEYLTQKTAREASPAEMMKQQFKRIRQQWGSGPEAMQKANVFAQQQGFSVSGQQFDTMWKASGGQDPGTRGVMGAADKGKGILAEQYKTGTASIMGGIGLKGAREELATSGMSAVIGQQTMAVETQILKSVSSLSKTAAEDLKGLAETVNSVGNALGDFKKSVVGVGESLRNLVGLGDKKKSKTIYTKGGAQQ